MRTIVPRSIFLAAVVLAAVLLVGCLAIATSAQEPAKKPADPRGGANFISTKVYSQEEDQKVLGLFAGLRV